MATHSSILAWEILWTKEPGGLQSMGSQSDMTEHACMHKPQHNLHHMGKYKGFPGSSVVKNPLANAREAI